jgi:lysophospholipase L1-like esterase
MSTGGATYLAENLASADPHVVTILYGINDLILEYSGEPRVSTVNFGEALRFMVRETRAEGAVPVLLSLVPVIPELYYLRHQRELYEQYGGIEAHWQSYDLTIRRIAEEEAIPLVDLQEVLGDSLEVTLGSDGAHPSAVGHEILARELFRTIGDLEFPEGPGESPLECTLGDCYLFPNPYRLSSGALLKVHVSVSGEGSMKTMIFDSSGREVAILPQVTFNNPGEHWLVWDGKDRHGKLVAPGVYLFSIEWSPQGDLPVGRKVMKVAVLR